MPKVTIKSIAKQSTMSDEDFAFIKLRIGAPLELMSVTYWRSEPHAISTFAVYTPDSCITLFPEEQGVEFEVNYNA